MKVIWLVSSYPRHEYDCASVFLRELSHALHLQGIEIHVLMPDDISINFAQKPIHIHTFRYFFPRKSQKLAYGSGILPNLQRSPLLYTQVPPFFCSMAWKLWWLCRQLRPELIHAHWIFPQGTVAAEISCWLNIPAIATAHGGDAFALNSQSMHYFKSRAIRQSAAWTCNTKATANAFTNRLNSLAPPQIIPMGVDYQRFAQSAPGKLSIEKGAQVIILFAGRLVEKKGVNDLVRSLPILEEKYFEKICLWIVGDGVEKKNLMTLVTKLGLEKKTRFWGTVSHQEIPTFYAAADLLVMPSITDSQGDTEGQGVVLVEAMAAGTPIITTRTGGISEVINHQEEGLLVEEKNPRQIAQAINQLLSDPLLRQRLAAKAQKKALSYDWQNIAKKFVALYQHTVSPKLNNKY